MELSRKSNWGKKSRFQYADGKKVYSLELVTKQEFHAANDYYRVPENARVELTLDIFYRGGKNLSTIENLATELDSRIHLGSERLDVTNFFDDFSKQYHEHKLAELKKDSAKYVKTLRERVRRLI